MTVRERAKKIKLLLLDVDGVLTDGRIIYDSEGRDTRLFNVHDGLGIYMLRTMGIPTILITAKLSKALMPRAKEMRVERVYGNIKPKTKVYEKIMKEFKLRDTDICFVGDDLIDSGILKRVGLPVAVANARQEVKDRCVYVTRALGGYGAVREVVELILKAQNKWKKALALYEK